jgi:hypothetical protein
MSSSPLRCLSCVSTHSVLMSANGMLRESRVLYGLSRGRTRPADGRTFVHVLCRSNAQKSAAQKRVSSYRMRQAQSKRAEAPRCGAREARQSTRALRCQQSPEREQTHHQRRGGDVEGQEQAQSAHARRSAAVARRTVRNRQNHAVNAGVVKEGIAKSSRAGDASGQLVATDDRKRQRTRPEARTRRDRTR